MLSNVGAMDFREEQNASTVFNAWQVSSPCARKTMVHTYLVHLERCDGNILKNITWAHTTK